MKSGILPPFSLGSRDHVFGMQGGREPGRNALPRAGAAFISRCQERENAPASAQPGSWRGFFCFVASCCAFVTLVVAGGLSAPAQGTNQTAPGDFSAFKIIIDRNIFDPDRRPMVASGLAPTIVDSFTLVGTMSYQKGLFAVFDGTSSEYRKVLQTGGAIAGYTVKEIRQETAKLASGTNELELSVGMQMRRNEDGRWSVGEQGESSGGSYASTSRRRGSGRRSLNSNPAQAGSRIESHSGASTGDQSAAVQVDDAPGAGAPPPPEATSSDPNDPVARMMTRRLQETGGSTNGTQNGNDN